MQAVLPGVPILDKVLFHWTIKGMIDNKTVLLDSQTTPIVDQKAILILNPFVLDGKQPYKVNVSVEVPGYNVPGFSVQVFEVNTPPKNGSCTFFPMKGVSLKDNFTLTCQGWSDEDQQGQPFLYSLWVGSPSSDKLLLMYRGVLSQSSHQLPVGSEQDDHNLQVLAYVEDALGAVAVGFKG